MIQKYAHYTLQDFIQDEQFVRWVRSPDAESSRFWSELEETYPFQQTTMEQARRTILNLREALQPEDLSDDVHEVWGSIRTSIARKKQSGAWWRKRPLTGIAASIALLISFMLGWQLWKPAMSKITLPDIGDITILGTENLIERRNTSPVPLIVLLPDHSKVTLQPGGKLRYRQAFKGSLREVHLEGEAFFDVTRRPENPFIVYSNGLITKVLGTSFNIDADFDGTKVTVSVKTGKVSVFTNPKEMQETVPDTNALILLPNQQANYTKGEVKLTKTLVSHPALLVPEHALWQFDFQNAAVSDIFQALEKAYGVTIEFDPVLLGACRLNSSLENSDDLFEKLDILCEAIGATYKVEEASVIISGKKCM